MSGDGTGFAPQYQQVLGNEQRQMVLATIRDTLSPAATLGEIVDAAEVLGWLHGVGELRLVDLAEALLSDPDGAAVVPANDDATAATAQAPGTKAKAAKKPAAKTTASKAAGKSAKGPGPEAFDERMSLEEAVEAFVPLVQGIGEATMQELEEATGLGRRKLRFHVGQLVKHGHLTRHGMGRGTFYTA